MVSDSEESVIESENLVKYGQSVAPFDTCIVWVFQNNVSNHRIILLREFHKQTFDMKN